LIHRVIGVLAPKYMAFSKGSWVALALLLFAALVSAANGDHKLSARYYEKTCPNVQGVVRAVMANTVASDPTVAPAILRLFFHDCFVNVCTQLTTSCYVMCSPANP
jgi:peroxidase